MTARAWLAVGAVLALVAVTVLLVSIGGSNTRTEPRAPTEPMPRADRPSGQSVVRPTGTRDEPSPAPAELGPTVRRVRRELGRTPQPGLILGDPDAPVSITEYGDLRCRECALIHRDVLPEVIRRFVASGEASLSFRPWTLYGPRSKVLARGALSASRQGRYWDYVQLAFLRGTRRTVAVRPAELASALGLDMARWRRDRSLPRWRIELEATLTVAEAVHLPQMPVFLIRRAGRGPTTVLAAPRSANDFILAIGLSARDLDEAPDS